VANAVGVATIPMGWLLGKHGIRVTKTHRGGKQGRCFTFDLRERIEELLSGGEPGPRIAYSEEPKR
jgi:hypothetical protein